MNMTVKFQRKNETKGAVRYEEIDPKGAVMEMAESQVGTLYIRKNALALPFPDFLTVTIKPGQ